MAAGAVRRPAALWLAAGLIGLAWPAGAAPLRLSPLPPLSPLSSGPDAAGAPAAAGLPKLPLFAKADDVKPVPFAAPRPGSVVDEEEETDEDAAKKAQAKPKKKV